MRHRYARRGGADADRFVPDPSARAAVEAEIARHPGKVRRALDAPTTDPAVRAEADAWLDRGPGVTPKGAAAVAAAANIANWQAREQMTPFADAWIVEHGLEFAALAAVELMAMTVADDNAPSGPHNTRDDRYGVRGLRPGEKRHGYYVDSPVLIALRVRAALAAATDDDHRAVVEALRPYRAAHLFARVATSVLVPAETEWVTQDVHSLVADRDGYLAAAMVTAVGSAEQASAIVPLANGWAVFGSMAMITTLVDGVGAGAATSLFYAFDTGAQDAESRRRVLGVLAMLPGDEVMRGLVERVEQKYVAAALLDAAERFPAPALRHLAEDGARPAVADLLRAHVSRHPDLVDEVMPLLSAAAAALVEGIVSDTASLVVAPAEAIPPILASPPWLTRAKAAKPVVIAGLAATDRPELSWLPGEREAWAERDGGYGHVPRHESWEKIAARIAENHASYWERAQFFVAAPEHLARPLLLGWRPTDAWDCGNWMPPIIARFGLDALPLALELAPRAPADMAPVLLPVAAPEIAVLAADWLSRLKTARRPALAWLLRHPEPAARALVPPALGKAGTARRQAEQALLALHAGGRTEAVRAAAAGYGPEAADAIETLLATDPLALLPARMPATPSWAVPSLLPPVRLRDGSGALPTDAVQHLITMVTISKLDEPYGGLELVGEACDATSLAEFAWGLFQRWQASGGIAKENWALDALGLLGDDETVRRLSPLILAWPGEGGHAKAVTGVNILAAIGTDVALMRLHGIGQRAKFKGLKSAANDKMAEVAAGLGLSAEQLADRLVPDFGLQADGSMRLDYGPRQFVVGFDEQLRPFVADADGKRLKALPKPGARDDDELAPAAYKQFSALKKDVRTVASDQVRRLERAMVTGRRWSGAEFRQLFVSHPLLWHIVRRLVWTVFDESDRPVGALRVAEDRSFSTVDDDEMPLDDAAIVGVAHPLHLGDSLAGWAEVFADYEILQPFPQLGRPTFRLSPEELATPELTRFEKITVPTTKLLGLERRGWRRETPQDAGIQGRFEATFGPKLEIALDIEPGIAVGVIDMFEEQTVTGIYLHDGTGSRWGAGAKGRLPLSALSDVAASELIRDLTEVTA